MSFPPRPSHARSRETHAKHTLIEGFHPPSPMLLYMPLGMMYIYTTERGEGWYRGEEEETKKLDLGKKKGNKSLDAVRGEKFLKMSLSRVSTYTHTLITSMILLPSVSTWLENITALGSEALVENDDVKIDRFCVFSSFVLAGLIVLFSLGGAV